jgi:hypothetical protein
MEAKLETKTEEYDNLRKYFEKIKREKWYLEKKAVEKYQSFYDKCICLWELCKNCYDKFGARPVWSLGSLTHSLDGCVANMKTYLWLFRQVQI